MRGFDPDRGRPRVRLLAMAGERLTMLGVLDTNAAVAANPAVSGLAVAMGRLAFYRKEWPARLNSLTDGWDHQDEKQTSSSVPCRPIRSPHTTPSPLPRSCKPLPAG